MALPSTGVSNPRARGKEKQEQALMWLNQWGYSTPEILALVCGVQRWAGVRLMDKLINQELARDVQAGSLVGYHRYITKGGVRVLSAPLLLALTEKGKLEAQIVDQADGATWSRQIHGIASVRHNLECQKAVARILIGFSNEFVDYIPEAALRAQSSLAKKQPDAVLIKDDGNEISLEMELSPKSRLTGALDLSFHAVANDLENQRFEETWFIFHSDTTRANYERRWNSRSLAVWEKCNGGRWIQTGERRFLDPKIKVRCKFLPIEGLLIGLL